jgi:hypothetical protein
MVVVPTENVERRPVRLNLFLPQTGGLRRPANFLPTLRVSRSRVKSADSCRIVAEIILLISAFEMPDPIAPGPIPNETSSR